MVGFLLEHYAGTFPAWLAPQQVRVIPITSAHNEAAIRIAERLAGEGVRAEADLSSERMNAKIRSAQMMKVPYMLVIGAREIEQGGVTVRGHGGADLGFQTLDQLTTFMLEGSAMPQLRLSRSSGA